MPPLSPTMTAKAITMQPPLRNRFLQAADAHRYTLAGRALITLESARTGAHYTYRVSATPDETAWFVSLLTEGSADEGTFTYLGLILPEERFILTKKSGLRTDSKPVQAFRFFWLHSRGQGPLPPDLIVRHEGTCGRCGRTLTVPESIERGIGPECAAQMGLQRSAPRSATVLPFSKESKTR